MTVLTAAKRHKMKKSQFALSGERFPMNDKPHQRLAISGATRSEHAGNISHETAQHIKAKARRMLGEKVERMKMHGGAVKSRADRARRH